MPRNEGPRRVLVCTELVTRSAFMRLLVPLQALAETGEVAPQYVTERQVSPPMLDGADVLVLQSSSSAITLEAARTARQLGARVVYDYCDDLLGMGSDVPVLGAHYADEFVRRVVEDLLAEADVVAFDGRAPAALSALDNLAGAALPWAMPPCVWAERAENPAPVVGVVADASRAAEVDALAPAFEELLSAERELSFDFVGYAPEALAGRGDRVRVVPPVADHRQHLELLRGTGWRAAVAPLSAEPPALAGSAHFDADYGYGGIPGVYGAAYGAAGRVIDGVSGMLAEDAASWVAGVRELLGSEERRREIAQGAVKQLAAVYSTAPAVEWWRDALGGALDA